LRLTFIIRIIDTLLTSWALHALTAIGLDAPVIATHFGVGTLFVGLTPPFAVTSWVRAIVWDFNGTCANTCALIALWAQFTAVRFIRAVGAIVETVTQTFRICTLAISTVEIAPTVVGLASVLIAAIITVSLTVALSICGRTVPIRTLEFVIGALGGITIHLIAAISTIFYSAITAANQGHTATVVTGKLIVSTRDRATILFISSIFALRDFIASRDTAPIFAAGRFVLSARTSTMTCRTFTAIGEFNFFSITEQRITECVVWRTFHGWGARAI